MGGRNIGFNGVVGEPLLDRVVCFFIRISCAESFLIRLARSGPLYLPCSRYVCAGPESLNAHRMGASGEEEHPTSFEVVSRIRLPKSTMAWSRQST